MLPCVYQ